MNDRTKLKTVEINDVETEQSMFVSSLEATKFFNV